MEPEKVKSFLLITAFLFLAHFFLMEGTVFAYSDEVNRLAEKLICTCGCDTMLVSDCECEAAAQMKDFIQEKLDSGVKPDEILDILVKTYGEKILAEPRREGFGLVAWVTPFLALLAGLLIVAFLIRIWTSKRKVKTKPSAATSSTERKYRKKIEEELEKWT